MSSLSICQSIISSIQNLLYSKDFLEAHRAKKRFVRKSGKLSMLHIIIYLFYTSKQAMNINLSNLRLELPKLEFPKVSKQAVSKARQGIFPTLFEALFSIAVDLFCKHVTRKKWRDKYNVYAVDGSRQI